MHFNTCDLVCYDICLPSAAFAANKKLTSAIRLSGDIDRRRAMCGGVHLDTAFRPDDDGLLRCLRLYRAYGDSVSYRRPISRTKIAVYV